MVKLLKSPWWDTLPILGFFVVAASEGTAYPVAGCFLVIWLFILAIRYLVK